MCYCCISMKDCKKAAIAWAKADTAIEIKSERKRKNHCGKHPEIALYFRCGRKAQSMEICTFCRNENAAPSEEGAALKKQTRAQRVRRSPCILLAAAPTAASCFRRWRRSLLLQAVPSPALLPLRGNRVSPQRTVLRETPAPRYSKKALPSGRALEHNKAAKPYFLKSLPDRPSRFNMPSSAATSAETSSASD